MTKQIRKTKALIDGVFRGLEAPADTFIAHDYAYPHRSEGDAMRSDWRRVGEEIHDAMIRTDVEAAA
jgi:hypothetical protein